MSEPTQTQEIAADVLATAVQKAIRLERERSDREVAIAIKTAKTEARVEARLDGHEARLNAINGSVRKTGESLDALKNHIIGRDEAQDKRNAAYDTKEEIHWKQKGQAFSRKQVGIGYITLFLTAASPALVELAKAFFG